MKFSRAIRHLNMKDVNRKQLQKEKDLKEGTLSEQPTMNTSNIYPQTDEVPNQEVINFVAASQGGYPLGLSASDGNHVGNADTDETGIALAPPHPVTGVRRSTVHITSGTGSSVALRPGVSTPIGFSDNPPMRTMGSALWFYDPNYNSGEGQWSHLEYGVEQGAWGFWDTVKSGQFAGLYIFNTNLGEHPSGDISDKIAGINFGANGQIGPPKNILITQRGIGDINYHGPITPGRLFGLSDQGYNYLDGRSRKRELRRGTRYRTKGGGAYPTTGRTTTFTTGSSFISAKDETGAPETPDTSRHPQINAALRKMMDRHDEALRKLEASQRNPNDKKSKDAVNKLVLAQEKERRPLVNALNINPDLYDPQMSGGQPVQGDFSGVGNGSQGTMPDDFRTLPPEDLQNIFSDPTSTEAQEATLDILGKEIAENKPETATKFEQFGKAGEVFLRYLTGTLPETIDNEFLGQEYVNSMIADAEPFFGDGVGNKLSFGDNILGTTQEPVRQGNTITVDFNYDFKTNAEELKGKEDQLNLLQNTLGRIAADAFGAYSIDGSPKFFGGIPIIGPALDLIAGGIFSKFIEGSKLLGGGQHTPGKLTMDLSQIASENPKLLSHLFNQGLISYEELKTLREGGELPDYDPSSEENFEYNKPSWFTFSYRTPDGRIFGFNYSGAFGELKLAGSRGEPGSMESGYGTRGYDPKTNSGGTSWTMDYDGTSMWDQPPKPDPKPKPKPDNRKDYEKNRDRQNRFRFNNSYKLKGELLSEAAKLGHFEPDILDVDIEDIRKGIMPEFPEKPPAEIIDGYHQDSKLKPKELNKEPYLKIDEKDLIRNHRLKPNEAQEMMQTIERINDHIKKHPEDLIHAQMRYPIDDPRLAELNWRMDQMLEAGEEYLDSNFKENQTLYKRAIDRTKNNIKLTDPKYAQQRYDELRGTVKPKKTNLVGRLGKHLNKYESKGVLRHVDSDDFKKINERKIERKEQVKQIQKEIEIEFQEKKNDWRKDLGNNTY